MIETKTVETITTEDWFVYKDTTILGKLMDRSGDYYTFLTDEGYVSTATNDLMGIEWYGQQIFYESGDCLGSLNYVSAKLSGTVGFYTTDPISYYMIDKASKQIVSNSYIEWGNCVVKEQVVFVSSYTVNDPQKSGVDENLVGSVYIEKGPL